MTMVSLQETKEYNYLATSLGSTIEDKTASEQVRLIAELDEKDKSVIFGLIETMLTKKKFKDFFHKNVAAL
jgi:hypothetical protein